LEWSDQTLIDNIITEDFVNTNLVDNPVYIFGGDDDNIVASWN